VIQLDAPENPVSEKAAGLLPEGPPPDVRSGYSPPSIDDLLKQSHAATAHTIAKWLLIILGGSVLLNYVCLMVLIYSNRQDGAKLLEDSFHTWLPVLSGLAGSAVTYYFTKNAK
jgi:hypothetical protein